MNLKEIAVSFLELIVSGKIQEAYAQYIGEDFLHHNPYFPGDATSLMNGMLENDSQSPNKIMQINLAIQENETVAVYSYLRQHADDLGAAVVHIFRFKNGKIVEMWDVGQAVPVDMVNENGMF